MSKQPENQEMPKGIMWPAFLVIMGHIILQFFEQTLRGFPLE
jgi:hypothetical protein